MATIGVTRKLFGWLVPLAFAVGMTAATSLAGVPAQADPPLSTLGGPVTDNAGVLGSDIAQVQQALNNVANKTNYQLFVVFVNSFDGMGGVEWADQTATNSHLGTYDLLLAVAVQDRLWGFADNSASGISSAEVTRIENAVTDKLRVNDWSGAAVAAANEIAKSNSGGSSGGAIAVIVLIVIIIVGVGVVMLVRKNRQKAAARPTDPSQLSNVPTNELQQRVGAALVHMDTALKSSGDELGFAQAEFGLEATDPFRAALASAQSDVAAAFAIQQRMGDQDAMPDPQRRTMLIEQLQLCDHAGDELDAQERSFEDLRKLVDRAGPVLDETEQRANEVEQRIPVSKQALMTLSTTYPASALASIATGPEQASALLVSVRNAIASGRAALAAQNKNQAVAYARVAQNAIDQAAKLLDAVDHGGDTLAQSAAHLQQGMASVQAGLADASQLSAIDPQLPSAPQVAEAKAAMSQAQMALSGGDPIAAMNRLSAAHTALDDLLAPARGEEAARQKAAAAAQQAIDRAQQAISQATVFINGRRTQVDVNARSNLSEATRLVTVAQQTLVSDPDSARASAMQAESDAQQALSMAQQDSDGWGFGGGTGATGGGGIGSVVGPMVAGAVLGDLLGGGRGFGGGFGSGRGGASFGGGGFGGGGFSGGGGSMGGIGGSFGGGGFHGGVGGHF